MKTNQRSRRTALVLPITLLLLVGGASAGPNYEILHAFGRDEGGLYDSLVVDQAGNLYGTERGGGTYGYGAVFELTRGSQGRWSESVLHSFNCKDEEGCVPEAGLALDAAGDLYGRTTSSVSGFGSVFELKPDSGRWTLTVLYDHGGPSNLLLDHAGNLYGTLGPGKYDSGAVGELVRDQGWKEHWLYSFCPQYPCVDGAEPFAGVTWGQDGSLYGTTISGGSVGYGVVFQLTPQPGGTWQETLLHSFPATKNDGEKLYDGVVLDKAGNIYGATYQGGSTNCGVIFRLSPKADGRWDEAILYDFPNTAEGCSANTLTFDKKGNLWGTAGGGTGECNGGCGVVFEMTPAAKGKWKYSVVHDFTGTDGAYPAAAVIFDKQGNLYGTTELGGPGHSVGVVFEIIP